SVFFSRISDRTHRAPAMQTGQVGERRRTSRGMLLSPSTRVRSSTRLLRFRSSAAPTRAGADARRVRRANRRILRDRRICGMEDSGRWDVRFISGSLNEVISDRGAPPGQRKKNERQERDDADEQPLPLVAVLHFTTISSSPALSPRGLNHRRGEKNQARGG